MLSQVNKRVHGVRLAQAHEILAEFIDPNSEGKSAPVQASLTEARSLPSYSKHLLCFAPQEGTVHHRPRAWAPVQLQGKQPMPNRTSACAALSRRPDLDS